MFRGARRHTTITFIAALAATITTFTIAPATAQIRGTIDGNGVIDNSGIIPFDQAYFAFEVEGPVGTLKEVPNWDELEQALINPYLFAEAPDVFGNFQGWESYRSTVPRRRSFIYRTNNGTGDEPCAPGSANCAEVPLLGHVIHPLNYNYQSGQELRLLNIDFECVDSWLVPNPCHGGTVPGEPDCTSTMDPVTGQITYEFTYNDVPISPGGGRIEEDEAAIDFNSPIAPEDPFCVTTVEPIPPPEGSLLCGADPGEPGYLGFGVRGATVSLRNQQYSMPAVPGGTADPNDELNGPKGSIIGLRLYDQARGFINVNTPETAYQRRKVGLRRPSIRSQGQGPDIHVGTTGRPDYLHNSADNLADEPLELLPSNENDYYRGRTRPEKETARNEAAALGKALFWDMQVGSDSVQACGSCHFHAGADNRIQGQANSNTAGGDITTFEMLDENGVTMTPNGKVGVNSFPLHKLVDFSVPTDPLVNPANIARSTNDVMSSMGVSRFTEFVDVPPIGTFIDNGAFFGVKSLPADVGNAVTDPFPINNGFRRVEPRHTPTFFGATLNFDNFWDGRARHDFNGGSVFGASDPQAHVMVHDFDTNTIVPTRQVIRFASLASLATGPALSENEMSFLGRSWPKLGKRLLQRGVTPLANQLVATDDSLLGRYSNQGGSDCASLPAGQRSGDGTTAMFKPGLCISYPALIRRAFYPGLWRNNTQHLNGCYTDGNVALHPNQCAAGSVHIARLEGGALVDGDTDPFDQYVLSVADGSAARTDTNQFTQMEANFALFFGLSIHAWGTILVPDDTPFDRFMDKNSDAFVSFGEANENALVIDLLTCSDAPAGDPCFTEVGNFKRDPDLTAKINCPGPEGTGGCDFVQTAGTRTPGDVDPLLGLDFFLGSNLSLKNPNFNTLRCGECHAGGTLTDHTVEISHQLAFNDWAQEFSIGSPGSEIFPEPLGRGRIIAGFALESEINGNAQDAIERNVADFCTIEPCVDVYGNAIPGGVEGGFPQGQALFDNGVYNIGVTPISDDVSRGGTDAFGWPLSLSRLMLKNVCGLDYTPGGDEPGPFVEIEPGRFVNLFPQPPSPGNICDTFDGNIDRTGGGVFEPTAQDQNLNPGFEEELDFEGAVAGEPPFLPGFLGPWASNINVGDEVQQDEVFTGLNTVMAEPMLEGFVDSFGPFDPAAILGENMNNAVGDQMAMWPNVNRVNAQGSFKAAPLRNIELTNPYFHDGGNLTLRQQLDFYMRGGNFPVTNKAHRDFLIMNLLNEDEALGGYVVPGPGCDPSQPLGHRDRSECLVVTSGTAGSVPQFSDAEKEEIIVSVVDYLLELTDERVKYERAPFDHPEIFVPLDATAPENGTFFDPMPPFTQMAGNRRGFMGHTATLIACQDSTGAPFPGATTACFRRVPEVGQGGNMTPLPNFLGIKSGPRRVGAAAFCDPSDPNFSHYCH